MMKKYTTYQRAISIIAVRTIILFNQDRVDSKIHCTMHIVLSGVDSNINLPCIGPTVLSGVDINLPCILCYQG